MKYSFTAVATLALSMTQVSAFPAAVFEKVAEREALGASTEDLHLALKRFQEKRGLVGFNAEQQVCDMNIGRSGLVLTLAVRLQSGRPRIRATNQC